MKIAFIPDAHIKSRDDSSDFYFSDDEMHGFLYKLSLEVDKVVLCGDFLELWQGKYPTKQSSIKEFYNTLDQYKKTIFLVLLNEKFDIIEGNHDDHLKYTIECKDKVSLEKVFKIPMGKLVVNHGIQDLPNRNLKFRKVVRFGSWLVGIMEIIIHKNWEHFVNKFLSNLFHFEIVGTNKAQVKEFKRRIDLDDDIIVYVNGHTHKPQILRFIYNGKERLFINAGYFDGVENYYCILDTDTLEIDPYKIIDTDLKKFKMSLEVGDIVLTYNKDNFFSKGIASVTDGDYSHAMLYIGGGRIVESTGEGSHIGTIDKYLSGMHNLCKVSLVDKSKVTDVVSGISKKLGIKYGYFQNIVNLLYILIYKITSIDLRKDIEIRLDDVVVCSQLVAEEIREKYMYDINAANFYPSDFLKYPDYFKFEKKITVNY